MQAISWNALCSKLSVSIVHACVLAIKQFSTFAATDFFYAWLNNLIFQTWLLLSIAHSQGVKQTVELLLFLFALWHCNAPQTVKQTLITGSID